MYKAKQAKTEEHYRVDRRYKVKMAPNVHTELHKIGHIMDD